MCSHSILLFRLRTTVNKVFNSVIRCKLRINWQKWNLLRGLKSPSGFFLGRTLNKILMIRIQFCQEDIKFYPPVYFLVGGGSYSVNLIDWLPLDLQLLSTGDTGVQHYLLSPASTCWFVLRKGLLLYCLQLKYGAFAVAFQLPLGHSCNSIEYRWSIELAPPWIYLHLISIWSKRPCSINHTKTTHRLPWTFFNILFYKRIFQKYFKLYYKYKY